MFSLPRNSVLLLVVLAAFESRVLAGGPACCQQWQGPTLLEPFQQPYSPVGYMVAFDRARGVLMAVDPQPGAYTWEWDGAKWDRAGIGISPTGVPTIVYNELQQKLFIYGATNNPFPSNTVWRWTGEYWDNPGGGALQFTTFQSIYNTSLQEIQLFSGGKAWNISSGGSQDYVPASPPHGSYGRIAYDRSQSTLVLYYPTQHETWLSPDAASFQLVATSGPGFDGVTAFDESRGTVVYFGFNSQVPQTWEWDGSAWNLRVSGNPAPRVAGTMTYNPIRQRVVMVVPDVSGVIWEWDGASWSAIPHLQPIVRNYPSMAFDSSAGVTMLFGGKAGLNPPYGSQPRFADTWQWDGASWIQRASTGPSGRYSAAMVYDSRLNQTVLFGGNNDSSLLADTWVWNGASWSNRTPNPSPTARKRHAMAFDSARGMTVLFGGGNNNQQFDDTWEWNGNSWIEKFPQDSPPPREWHSMTYDSVRGVIVMVGGFGPGASPGTIIDFSDTWEYDGVNWVERSHDDPLARGSNAAMAFDQGNHTSALVGGINANPSSLQVRKALREWDGTTWHYRQFANEPSPDSHAMVYDSQRGNLFVFGGMTDAISTPVQWEYANDPACASYLPIPVAGSGSPGATGASDRYLILNPVDDLGCGAHTALRITTAPHSGCTNVPNADYQPHQVVYWVGPELILSGQPTGIHRPQSDPYFSDWSSVGSVLQIADCQIVPCRTYVVDVIREEDWTAGNIDAFALEPFQTSTTKLWGDVVGPGASQTPDGVVNITDVAAIVNCFKGVPGAPPTSWCDLAPARPDGSITIEDIAGAVDAFKGRNYPYYPANPTLGCAPWGP